jgi:hypothetical protein
MIGHVDISVWSGVLGEAFVVRIFGQRRSTDQSPHELLNRKRRDRLALTLMKM